MMTSQISLWDLRKHRPAFSFAPKDADKKGDGSGGGGGGFLAVVHARFILPPAFTWNKRFDFCAVHTNKCLFGSARVACLSVPQLAGRRT